LPLLGEEFVRELTRRANTLTTMKLKLEDTLRAFELPTQQLDQRRTQRGGDRVQQDQRNPMRENVMRSPVSPVTTSSTSRSVEG
jgi:hypothetical protein